MRLTFHGGLVLAAILAENAVEATKLSCSGTALAQTYSYADSMAELAQDTKPATIT